MNNLVCIAGATLQRNNGLVLVSSALSPHLFFEITIADKSFPQLLQGEVVVSDGMYSVWLYRHVNTSSMLETWYGFSDIRERQAFLALLGVDKVGPKSAMKVLEAGWPVLRTILDAKDFAAFSRLKGVGSKAEAMFKALLPGADVKNARTEYPDAVAALVSLGYKASDANARILTVMERDYMTPEALIKAVLKTKK